MKTNSFKRWENVLLARHPDRPYTLDYIKLMMADFVELHGDRYFADDKAIVGGFAYLDGKPVMVIGHQKGRDTNSRILRNFGCAHAEGCRKALRLMKLAAKFGRPIITLIDTPGAAATEGAEERGVAQAIAQSISEMSQLATPIIVVIIGEGCSGGALALGVGDRILMLEHAYYSVISPEGCASILWKGTEFNQEAAEAMKVTAADVLEQGVIDRIIPEPAGGAHTNHAEAARLLKKVLLVELRLLQKIKPKKLVASRQEKFSKMGSWKESWW